MLSCVMCVVQHVSWRMNVHVLGVPRRQRRRSSAEFMRVGPIVVKGGREGLNRGTRC
jgi:hypothetical protein